MLADKLEEYRSSEDSLRTVLLGAQKLGDNIIRESKAKAEVMMQEATSKSESLLQEASSRSESMIADTTAKMLHEKEILDNIKRSSKTVRYDLAQQVKETLRKCPDLQFYLDDSLDYAENIDRLLGSR